MDKLFGTTFNLCGFPGMIGLAIIVLIFSYRYKPKPRSVSEMAEFHIENGASAEQIRTMAKLAAKTLLVSQDAREFDIISSYELPDFLENQEKWWKYLVWARKNVEFDDELVSLYAELKRKDAWWNVSPD